MNKGGDGKEDVIVTRKKEKKTGKMIKEKEQDFHAPEWTEEAEEIVLRGAPWSARRDEEDFFWNFFWPCRSLELSPCGIRK